MILLIYSAVQVSLSSHLPLSLTLLLSLPLPLPVIGAGFCPKKLKGALRGVDLPAPGLQAMLFWLTMQIYFAVQVHSPVCVW